MEITIEKLSEMLSKAFDCGYVTHHQENAVADILLEYEIDEKDDKPPEVAPAKDVDFRVYKSVELRMQPVGTVFLHSVLGKCTIQKRYGDKYMAFDNAGLAPAGFADDRYPWDLPIKLVSRPNER